jgi:hypothetical protein
MDRTLHRAVAAAVCAAVCLVLASSASAATVPPGMLGMNDWTPPSEATLASVHRAGESRWRAPLFWYLIERERGVRDWSEYDSLVAASARQRVSLLFVVASCPDWACDQLSGPPTRADAISAQQSFLRAAVSRYSSNGSFWREHPELPRLPVTDWQVWNEVNSREFWAPGPNAADYARFLRGDSAAIRSVDPHATVVLSGLTEYGQVSISDYLRQLYAQPGFKSSFDVVALHAYAPDAPAVGRLLDRAKRVMDENGDASRHVWITEMGWGTSTASLHTPTTEAEQADLLRESYDLMIGCRARWNLSRAYWFAYRDFRPAAGQPDLAGYHTGLFDLSGRAKPGWAALQEYRDGAVLPAGRAEGCGSTAAPADSLQTRIRGRRRFRGTRRVRLRLVASVPGARFQCRLSRVGKRKKARWRRCRARYRTPRLRRGRYRLLVRAVDAGGHADRSPARARIRVRRGRRTTIRVRVLR